MRGTVPQPAPQARRGMLHTPGEMLRSHTSEQHHAVYSGTALNVHKHRYIKLSEQRND